MMPPRLPTQAFFVSCVLRTTSPSGLPLASRLRFNRPCPPSPAANIQNAKTAVTSISATFTLARSRAVLASPTTRKLGNGCAASIRGPPRTNSAAAQPPPSTMPAPISSWCGGSSRPVAGRPTIRHGAISGIGPLGNTRCGSAASGYHLKRSAGEVRNQPPLRLSRSSRAQAPRNCQRDPKQG